MARKLFIYEKVDHVSGNYHHDGALVVIADDEERARALIKERVSSACSPDSVPRVFELADDPDPEVFIFPDAGCC